MAVQGCYPSPAYMDRTDLRALAQLVEVIRRKRGPWAFGGLPSLADHVGVHGFLSRTQAADHKYILQVRKPSDAPKYAPKGSTVELAARTPGRMNSVWHLLPFSLEQEQHQNDCRPSRLTSEPRQTGSGPASESAQQFRSRQRYDERS